MNGPTHNSRLSIEYVPIGQIQTDPLNPREHKKRHIRLLANNILAFGFNVPVGVDAELRLLSGHGRLAAAKLAGLTEIPVIFLHHLDQHQRRAFMIADNRLHDLSNWHDANLATILLELSEAELSFDIEVVGFSVGEIDLRVTTPADEEMARDEDQPAAGPAVAVLGDLWSLGDHRVVCGDALRLPVYQQLLGDEQADVVATDPPYNVKIDGNVSGLGKVKHRSFVQGTGEMSEAQFIAFLEGSMRNVAAYSRDGSLHYWAMDWRHLYELTVAAKSVYDDQINLCVWSKQSAGMGSFYRSQHELFGVWRKGDRHRNNVQLGRFGRTRTNVWSYPSATSFSRSSDEGNLYALHPTVKPVALLADILLDCTKRGHIVLDPFAGSGSTLIAAEKVGRKARAIEKDPLYVDTIIRRWQRWSGEKAYRADGRLFDELEMEATAVVAPVA